MIDDLLTTYLLDVIISVKPYSLPLKIERLTVPSFLSVILSSTLVGIIEVAFLPKLIV
jgi:hypothetical protein